MICKQFDSTTYSRLDIGFMYIRNSVGPRTDPCGTPHFIFFLVPNECTQCASSHMINFRSIPKHTTQTHIEYYIYINWWSIESKFLRKSVIKSIEAMDWTVLLCIQNFIIGITFVIDLFRRFGLSEVIHSRLGLKLQGDRNPQNVRTM